jgi:hypothetical protein
MTLDAARIAANLTATLELVEQNRSRLAATMNDAGEDVDSQHVKLALDLARASVELSKEARSWAKTSKEVGKKLTRAEQNSLIVQHINALSKSDRDELLAQVKQ